MAFIDDYDFEPLVNEAEKLVLTELGRQLENRNVPLCTCNECVMDMAAMALNAVKPLYRVSLLGTLYASRAMDEKGYASSIREAVFNAIERVRKNPGHEIEEET
jgi:competence protein ComFB